MVGGISRGQRQYRLAVTMVTICVSPLSFSWLLKCPSPLETVDVNATYQPDCRCGTDGHHFCGSHVLSSVLQMNVDRQTARQEVTMTCRVIYSKRLYGHLTNILWFQMPSFRLDSTKTCRVHELRYILVILLYGFFENVMKCKYLGTTQTDQNAGMKKLRAN
jgi:hypothetical protein